MIVKFFKRGGVKDNKFSTGGKSVQSYLLGKNNDRQFATLLTGDPNETTEIINSLDFAKIYTAGCLAFDGIESQTITDDQKQILMQDFERALFGDFDRTRISGYWVEHMDKIDKATGTPRLELNFVFANVDLLTGKNLPVYYHRNDKHRVNDFKDLANLVMGLSDPNDPIRTRTTTIDINQSKDQKELKKAIGDHLTALAQNGQLPDHKAVKKALTDIGLTITATKNQSISIANPDPDKSRPIRLTGAFYEQQYKFADIINQPADRPAEADRAKRVSQLSSRLEQSITKRTADLYTRLIPRPNKRPKSARSANTNNRPADPTTPTATTTTTPNLTQNPKLDSLRNRIFYFVHYPQSVLYSDKNPITTSLKRYLPNRNNNIDSGLPATQTLPNHINQGLNHDNAQHHATGIRASIASYATAINQYVKHLNDRTKSGFGIYFESIRRETKISDSTGYAIKSLMREVGRRDTKAIHTPPIVTNTPNEPPKAPQSPPAPITAPMVTNAPQANPALSQGSKILVYGLNAENILKLGFEIEQGHGKLNISASDILPTLAKLEQIHPDHDIRFIIHTDQKAIADRIELSEAKRDAPRHRVVFGDIDTKQGIKDSTERIESIRHLAQLNEKQNINKGTDTSTAPDPATPAPTPPRSIRRP